MKKIIIALLTVNLIFLTSCFKTEEKIEEVNTWKTQVEVKVWTWETNSETVIWTWEINSDNDNKEEIKDIHIWEKDPNTQNPWIIIEVDNKETDKKVNEEIEDVLKSLDVPIN